MKPTQMVAVDQAAVTRALVSPETMELVTFGERRGWEPRVLGRAPLPQSPVRVGEWLIVPAEQDTSAVPARALRRVQALYEAGLRPQGFVIVHEAPMQLAAPKSEDKVLEDAQPLTVSPVLRSALGALGRVLAVVASALAIVGISVFAGLPLALLMGVVMLDPMLIVVTEDGHWVEIDRWWNE